MATAAAEQKREELELTRESLARNVDRLGTRVRAELDWKARLRRDGPQIAAIGGAVVTLLLVATVLRKRLRRHKDGYAVADFDHMDLGDIATELRAMRKELEKQRDASGSPVLRLATAAVTAAAAAAGKAAAARMIGEDDGAGDKATNS